MFGELLAPTYLRWLLDGFLLTLALSLLCCVLATLLGAPLAIARLARSRWLSWPARAYLALFRNTPLLVQLFFWYFGVPALLPEELVCWLNSPHELRLARLAVVRVPRRRVGADALHLGVRRRGVPRRHRLGQCPTA